MTAGFNLENLKIEVLSYEYQTWDNYYDANWLCVSVLFADASGQVAFSGPILMTANLVGFHDEVVELDAGTSDVAVLESLEPNLSLTLKRVGSLGHIEVTTEILVEPQMHELQASFQVDVCYLPKLVTDLRGVLSAFPVRLEDTKSV
ncbi:hypothetical protein N9Z87_01865 [Amylibacter sp.]|nr:hypothetical protein [Amylibacter sp.]